MLVFTPQPHYHVESPRDRYLRAVAEENAARQAYAAQLAQDILNPCNSYDRHCYAPRYDSRGRQMHFVETPSQRQMRMEYLREQQEAREREFKRQQEIEAARRAAMQAQQERLARHKQRIAEARRHEYEQYLQQQQQQQRRHSLDEAFASIFGVPLTRHSEQQQPHDESMELKSKAAQRIQQFFRAAHARRPALMTLQSIRDSLDSLTSSFTFPDTLDFSTESSAPKLLYTHSNAPVLSYEDSLVKLLSKLDSVESGGDKVVRRTRKELANSIEKVLAELDNKKDELWKKLQKVEKPVEEIAPMDVTGEPVIDEPTSVDLAASAPIPLSVPEPESVTAPEASTQDSGLTESVTLPQQVSPVHESTSPLSSPHLDTISLPTDSSDSPVEPENTLIDMAIDDNLSPIVEPSQDQPESDSPTAFLSNLPPSAPTIVSLPVLNDPQVIALDDSPMPNDSDDDEHDAVMVESELQIAEEAEKMEDEHSVTSLSSESSVDDEHEIEHLSSGSHTESEDFEVL